jgi:Acetyltransferase (GNAT) domain
VSTSNPYLLRAGHPLLTTADPVLDRLGTAVVHGDTVHLRLERVEREIWSGMRPTLRRQIRRLKELGYAAERDEWSRLGDFKELYHDTMRRVGATPFYNFSDTHFDVLRALLGGRLHLVTVLAPNGKVVGGALNTACHGFVQGHLLGAETFEDIPSPALLLYDAEWRWAKQRGDRFFNLGGGRGGRNDSLFQYKKGFSDATAPFRTVRIVCEPGRYRRACAAAGVDGADLSGFFPPYRSEPLDDKSPDALSTLRK